MLSSNQVPSRSGRREPLLPSQIEADVIKDAVHNSVAYVAGTVGVFLRADVAWLIAMGIIAPPPGYEPPAPTDEQQPPNGSQTNPNPEASSETDNAQ